MSTTLIVFVPMHGLGGRSDLPAPGWLVAYAGAVVVLVSFFALAALSTRSRWGASARGVALPRLVPPLGAVVVRLLLRTLGISLLLMFLLVAWFGPGDHGELNPAPTWFYVWFWVGLVPVSLLLGPFWAQINPLHTIADGVRVLLRNRPRVVFGRVAYWPAVASLLAFLWLELVYDESASSRVVALFVSIYAVGHVVGGVVFGPCWFGRCDGFEVYSSMLARAAPFGRTADGKIVLRNPLDGLASAPLEPDLSPVVIVVLGSTAFDGLSRTSWWSGLTSGTDRITYLTIGTVGLAGAIVAVGLLYAVAVASTRPFLDESRQVPTRHFAHTLIPIAVGYTVAHYFSFAVFQGQQGAILASDPFDRGWDLLGLQGRTVSYSALSATAISVVQVSAIVIGHVVAVLAAHDRAVSLLRPRDVLRGQYAMIAVMVLFTTTGIALIAGA